MGLGWLLAVAGVHVLLALKPENLPRLDQIQLDPRVLVFTIVLVALATMLLGLAVARKAWGLNMEEVLKEGAGTGAAGPGRMRGRRSLVTAQIAVAMVLLIGAALLMRSLWRLLQVKPGLDPDRVLTARISLPETRYPDESHIVRFYDELLRKVQEVPGVENAGLVTMLPLQQSWCNGGFEVEGRPVSTRDLGLGMAELRAVSPDYYRALGIPLIEGRSLTDADTSGSLPVVIINQRLARHFWPHGDPLGKRIEIAGRPPWYTIVGVVGNVRQAKLDVPIQYETDVPYTQWPSAWPAINGTMSLVLRTRVKPAAEANAVRSAVLSVDPDQPTYRVETMRTVVSRSMVNRRFNMLLLSIFAALGLVLASLGIYGVLSYTVRQRTHEIGVRMALGAQKSAVLRMVIGQGLRLAFIGVAIGVAGALALTRFLSSLLYGVKPTDPITFVVVSAILICVALLACYIPARRAAKVDPMVALRYE